MKISENGLNKIIEWEGCILHIYKDAAGLDTIGVGHLIQKGERFHSKITEEEAKNLLEKDLIRFEEALNKHIKVPLTQSQYDALVAFAFNVGVGAFKTSTLLKKLNLGKYTEVPSELIKWTKAGGKICKGLVNRRNKEIGLWNS